MAKIKIKNQSAGSLILRKLDKTEHINTIELDILKKNEIPTLFSPQKTLEIQKGGLCYRIDGCVPLSELLSREMEFGLFCRLILDLTHTVQDCNAHGIRSSNLELNAESVFYDKREKSFRFLFWPLITLEEATDFRAVFESLGRRFTPAGEDQECRRRYLSFFDSRAQFNIAQMEKHALALQEWWAMRSVPEEEGRRLVITELSTGKRAEAAQFPFVVGRSPENCSFSWPGDASMSRRHFSLYRDGGAVFLTDLGSANGTVLNETHFLSPHADKPTPEGLTRLKANPQIKHGDQIRAGKTVFRCQFI